MTEALDSGPCWARTSDHLIPLPKVSATGVDYLITLSKKKVGCRALVE